MIKNSESSWISFSDLMTALMVVFMFIAISYMASLTEREEDVVAGKKELETAKSELEKTKDSLALFKVAAEEGQQRVQVILDDFQNTKDRLLMELKTEFANDFRNWEVEIDDDLSIKFTNPDILFAKGKKDLRPKFKEVLREFLPRYFGILLAHRYRSKILEVRIEGHTDRSPALAYDKDPYISNIMLSQERSTEVLKYFNNTYFYKNLSKNDKDQLLYVLTANGLSYGKMLDDDKVLVELSHKEPNEGYSRRVEFKIVTKTEDALSEILKQYK